LPGAARGARFLGVERIEQERRVLVRRLIIAAAASALLWPLGGACQEDVLQLGFQFSATSPQGPDELTDYSSGGLQFRTFYRVMSFSKSWQLVGEFGYNTFNLREGKFESLIEPVIADSMAAALEDDAYFPAGSTVSIVALDVTGGDFNAAHVTAGLQYTFFAEEEAAARPYLTVQGGYYSTGQSDTDVGLTLDVHRPEMADTTLSVPSIPFMRDDDRDNAFGLNFGGGVELVITGQLSVIGDFRYHVAFTDERKTTFYDAGLGLAYYLGF